MNEDEVTLNETDFNKESNDNIQATEKENQNVADETQKTENTEEQDVEKELTVEEKLEQANKEIETLNDQLLRKIAEFDNYRKRTIKEKTELVLNGGEKTIKAILPVLDDMERALSNMQKAEDVAAVVEGVQLIYRKFMGILEKEGVKTIQTENQDFNVDLHEAIAQLPAPTDELKGKIMDCTLTGYTLNDKVIRHSQVVVGL